MLGAETGVLERVAVEVFDGRETRYGSATTSQLGVGREDVAQGGEVLGVERDAEEGEELGD